jgi:hypothetical protein
MLTSNSVRAAAKQLLPAAKSQLRPLIILSLDCMIKRASLFSFATIVLLTSCKQASFLKQRYTHFGHSKPAIKYITRTPKPPLEVNWQPATKHAKVHVAEAPRPAAPRRSADLPPVQPGSLPVRHNQSGGALTASAQHLAVDTWALKKLTLVPAKIKKSPADRSDGIPIISPLLKIVILVLLIVLVAGLIILIGLI